MTKKLHQFAMLFATTLLSAIPSAFAQSPTAPAQNFNIFTKGALVVYSSESEGPVACNQLILQGDFNAALHSAGTFTVGNTRIGLLVNKDVQYYNGNSCKVLSNGYVKIGQQNSSVAWYYDQNNAASPIRVTPGSNYNGSPRIELNANSNQLGVGVNNNPVFQDGLIDLATAFQEMKASALSMSQCTGNAQLTNPNGQSIPTTNLPNQVKINLQDGINYLNITGADLNAVQNFTYNQQPSASKVLVVNVNAPGSFVWHPWTNGGVGFQQCPYILYNFYNTTDLSISSGAAVEGTVFAPFADVYKGPSNMSNIEGQVIAQTYSHSGGEVHYAVFSPSISGCATPAGVAPVAAFTVDDNAQCLDGNQFTFTNTSNTGGAVQPEAPVSYSWSFGDGLTSTAMNPIKTYSASGTYTVTLTASNVYGSSTTSSTVTVYDAISVTGSETTVSSGSGSVVKQFTIVPNGAYTAVAWTLNGVAAPEHDNQTTANFTFTDAGYYIVNALVTDSNGCIRPVSFGVVIASEDVNTGNGGGLESESLGDAVSKQYVHRKMTNIPTVFVKDNSNVFNKAMMLNNTAARTSSLSMLDMFPATLGAGSIAHTTSPTDILDYTIAQDVYSVDYSVGAKTKAVVLGVFTKDKVYNHTKASCDRLRGAEIMNVKTLQLNGYNFLMQAIKQRNGVTEYAISFAVAKNNNDNAYTLQTNWFVKSYTEFNEMYNFQVWATTPENTEKLVKDILNNLTAAMPVVQTEVQKMPATYAAKVWRDGINLVMKLRSTKLQQQIEISMEEVYNETNGFALRYNPFNSEFEQTVSFEIKDGYEYDGLLKVNGEIQDAFYHADGNWGLDFDRANTVINNYVVSNNFDRVYNSDELAVNRNVTLQAHSNGDYLTLYKSLLPGQLPADYTEYGFLAFTAKGSGLLEIGLVKPSIENWKDQYRANINLQSESQTYYIPFSYFKSIQTISKLVADDLSLITFTFLPVGSKDLDLTIEDVKFTKSAPEGYKDLLNTMVNEYKVYPNPSLGNVNCLLYTDAAMPATVTLHDITGKLIFSQAVQLEEGKNELEFNLNVPQGIMFLNISNDNRDFGTMKVIFK